MASGLRGTRPLTRWLASAVAGWIGLSAAGCDGADRAARPTAPAAPTETATVSYRDAASGAAVDGTVAYTDAAGRPASAPTGSTITLLEGSRLRIEAAGYSPKETDARASVDGAYWAIPSALQAAIDRARGDGGLERPALDASFDVVLDRLTFSGPELEAVRQGLAAIAPVVTAGRYRWLFQSGDDPTPRQGAFAVAVAGAVTFAPFLVGEELVGGRLGIDPSDAGSREFERMTRLAAARMVGYKAPVYHDDPRVFLALTRLPIGNRAPNTDP